MRSIWENNFYNIQPALSWVFKFNFNNFLTLSDWVAKYVGTSEVCISSVVSDTGEIGSVEDENGNTTEMLVTAGKKKLQRIKLFDEDEYLPIFDVMDNGTEYAQILSTAATSITLGERSIEQTDLYYGGLTFKKTTRVNNNGTFTIKFNENEDYTVTKILDDIFAWFNSDRYYLLSGLSFSNNTYEGNDTDFCISVQLYNNLKNSKKYILDDSNNEEDYLEYKFINCKLIGIENMSLSYESTDTITRNATFSYDYMYFNNKIDDDVDDNINTLTDL